MRRNRCSSRGVGVPSEKLAPSCEVRIICGRWPQVASRLTRHGERLASVVYLWGWYDWWEAAKLPTLAATLAVTPENGVRV